MPDERETPYKLPQEYGEPDPEAVEAAIDEDAPPAAPGMAGESAPGQPSRAEIFALNPEATDGDSVFTGSPTMPVGPEKDEPYVAGAPEMGSTEPLRSAPPAERPESTSAPEETHKRLEPPKAGED